MVKIPASQKVSQQVRVSPTLSRLLFTSFLLELTFGRESCAERRGGERRIKVARGVCRSSECARNCNEARDTHVLIALSLTYTRYVL